MSTRTRTADSKKKPKKAKAPKPEVKIATYEKALKHINLVAVAYSHVEREWFPNDEAYEAEREVEDRAQDVLKALEKLGINAKAYPGDPYFFTNLLVDDPNLVLNLVDTLRGKDSLQTSVPAALELANIPYTGAGMRGLVIGNDRHLIKQLLKANQIPTPDYQFIPKKGGKVDPELGLPLIVKLNESGGSVGIDDQAVKETIEDAQKQVDELIATYKMPVIIERFIDGPEITVVAFDDGQRLHIFSAQKKFGIKPDGKHEFTSIESYQDEKAYTYWKVRNKDLAEQLETLATRAFKALHHKDYAKFDIRVDAQTNTPYFTDSNPNTAFGPSKGLPFTEVLLKNGVKFDTILLSLVSKYAKQIQESQADQA